MNQNVVGTEQSRQQQLNEMLYGNGKERWAIETLSGLNCASVDLISLGADAQSRALKNQFCVKFRLLRSRISQVV